MVEIHDIVKSYPRAGIEALKNITFDVEKGELFGLIGPDGAGKSSLFRILTTLLLPDAGKAIVNGMDVVQDFKKIRKEVGYMPGRFSLYQDLSVEENLRFFATVFGTTIEENYHLIRDIYQQIEPFKKRRAGKLSGGMKQKLALCCALIHRPTVLFLDEPTTGVDVVSRKEFWEMLKNLQKMGITILVSTPYMDEATLCDRIALIQSGNILSINTPSGTIDSYPETLFAAKAENMSGLLRDLRNQSEVNFTYSFGDEHHLILNNVEAIDTLKNKLSSSGHGSVKFNEIPPTIEDCFINLMR